MEIKPKALKILDIATLVILVINTIWIIGFVPPDALMGNVQKIFYYHVSAGWVGMIGFFTAVVAGIAFLRTKNSSWDLIGVAGVEVGLVYTIINIVSGSIWARATWGTWWNWDPRLVTATVMALIYVALLMLRQGIDEPNRRMRFSAIYAIMGFVSVPITFFSVRIMRTIHPVVIASADAAAEGGLAMGPTMKMAFFISLGIFSIVAVDLIWNRIRLGKMQRAVEAKKMRMLS